MESNQATFINNQGNCPIIQDPQVKTAGMDTHHFMTCIYATSFLQDDCIHNPLRIHLSLLSVSCAEIGNTIFVGARAICTSFTGESCERYTLWESTFFDHTFCQIKSQVWNSDSSVWLNYLKENSEEKWSAGIRSSEALEGKLSSDCPPLRRFQEFNLWCSGINERSKIIFDTKHNCTLFIVVSHMPHTRKMAIMTCLLFFLSPVLHLTF